MLFSLEAIQRKLCGFLLGMAGFFLLFMVVLSCSNMVLRAVWLPVKGTFELLGFSGALAAALALAATQRAKGHITVTFLKDYFPAWLEKSLVLSSFVLSSLFSSLICWQCGQRALGIWRSGEVSETLHILYYPFVFAVAAGFAALALVLLSDFLRLASAAPARRKS